MVNLYLIQLALRKKTQFHSWYRIENMYNCECGGSAEKRAAGEQLRNIWGI